MATTASITRSELGLSVLSLSDTTYGIRAFDPGEVGPLEEIATSPFVIGGYDVGNSYADAYASLVLRVTGTSDANLQAAVSAAISAFRQRDFTLTVTVGSTAWSLTGHRARHHVVVDDLMHRRNVELLALTFRRSPVTSAGTF